MEAVNEIQRFINILTFLYDGLANIYLGSLIIQRSRYRQLTPIVQRSKGSVLSTKMVESFTVFVHSSSIDVLSDSYYIYVVPNAC